MQLRSCCDQTLPETCYSLLGKNFPNSAKSEKIAGIFCCDSDSVAEILACYEASSRADLAAMQRALDAHDLPALCRAAHSLKGSSAYLQVEAFDAIIQFFEQAARDGDWQAVHDRFPRLKAAHTQLLEHLSQDSPRDP